MVNCFWQNISKEELDSDCKLSIKDWYDFVNDYQSIFAAESLKLAKKLLVEYVKICKKE